MAQNTTTTTIKSENIGTIYKPIKQVTISMVATKDDICDHPTPVQREPITDENRKKAEAILFGNDSAIRKLGNWQCFIGKHTTFEQARSLGWEYNEVVDKLEEALDKE
jgi:hypothetical protein